jgi:hypothetical protein
LKYTTFLLLVALIIGAACSNSGSTGTRGWAFVGERVVVDVEDTLVVIHAHYVFRPPPGAGSIALRLPFPEDGILGEPRLLEATTGLQGGRVALPVVTGGRAWSFVLEPAGAAACSVSVSYCQATRGGHAEYILRSARQWGRPLEWAVLEVMVPQGRDCIITPPLEAAGARDGKRLFRATYNDWVPRDNLIVDLVHFKT